MNQKFLSVAIPTYNRAACLRCLLDNIIPQVLKFRDEIEICISDNGSSDNTKEVAMAFQEKYPDLIKYRENEKNLGYDINFLKVVSMAEGEFVWTCSDDDLPVKNGVKNVIEFIKENKGKKIGGMVIKFNSYVVDTRTGKRIKYQSSVDKNKPEMYGGLNCLEMLKDDLPYQGLSVLIFNNRLLKKILREKQDLVKKGINTLSIHSWLFFLSFLLNKEAKCYVLNKTIMISPDTASKYKYLMEDFFGLIYKGRILFFGNLLSIVDRLDKEIINAIKKLRGYPVLSFIYIMALYKAFGIINYTSCVKCIKFSFKHLSLVMALLILASLIIILIIPSGIVKKICKLSLRVRPKTKEEVESNWTETCIAVASWGRE